MESIIEKLRKYEDPTPDDWREKVEFMRDNQYWLRYSNRIAMKMLLRMDELKLTQQEVAERLGCSQQYISKILKGQENLSLETIAKIESALDLKFFSFDK